MWAEGTKQQIYVVRNKLKDRLITVMMTVCYLQVLLLDGLSELRDNDLLCRNTAGTFPSIQS